MYQDSLWMVLAATLQLWFILNLLLVFVRILDLTQLCFILNLLLMCVGLQVVALVRGGPGAAGGAGAGCLS